MDAQRTYMHVRIQLVRGRSGQFVENMTKLAALLEAEYDWRLVGGFMTTIGRIGEVVHVWDVPSANDVIATLAAVRARPETAEWSRGLAESVADEVFYPMQPMPYSPRP